MDIVIHFYIDKMNFMVDVSCFLQIFSVRDHINEFSDLDKYACKK